MADVLNAMTVDVEDYVHVAAFADIVSASNRQCALPQASLGSITLANEIRSSAGAGLDFLQASIDGHETKPGE